MREKNFKDFFKRRAAKIGSVLLVGVLLAGGGIWIYDAQYRQGVPELVTYVDTEGEITIGSDEVPLGSAPEVKTKTTQRTKKKKVKLKTQSKKTYTKKKKPKSTTKTRTTNQPDKTVTVKTVTMVNTTERYKKGSKIKTVFTTTKKVVTTTTVEKDNSAAAASVQQNKTSISTSSGTAVSGASGSNTVVNGEISIAKVAPKVDSRVSNAFTTLGFKIYINSGVSYSGLCDTKTRSITLRSANETSYHELGHFLAFIAGNADKSAEFQSIYSQEKSKYTAINKAYATQNSSEYFAESFKEYTLNPGELKSSRPNTYNAIVNALSKVTDQQIAKVQSVYGPIWK